MPEVNGKKFPYTAAGKKAAKKAAKKESGKPAPMPKKPTLNDYLKRNMKPLTKGKKAPPDYDVITPDMGYTKPTKKNPPKKIKKK